MTVTVEERAEMLEVALRMIDNLLDLELTEIGRRNAQQIIRFVIKETSK